MSPPRTWTRGSSSSPDRAPIPRARLLACVSRGGGRVCRRHSISRCHHVDATLSRGGPRHPLGRGGGGEGTGNLFGDLVVAAIMAAHTSRTWQYWGEGDARTRSRRPEPSAGRPRGRESRRLETLRRCPKFTNMLILLVMCHCLLTLQRIVKILDV